MSREARIMSAMFVIFLPSSLLGAPPPQVGEVLQRGFRIHTSSCFEILEPQGIGQVVKYARCSPGGAWGSYLYVSWADGYDPFTGGGLARLDGRGRVEDLLGADGPGDFAFSAAASPFADRLWLDSFTPSLPVMYGFDSAFAASAQTCADPARFVFDRSGAFGYALYTPVAGGIGRLNDPADCSSDPAPVPGYELFSAAPAVPLAFGPGGDWGSSLYAGPGTIVEPDGSFAAFPFSFGEVTWADPSAGSSWNGDMFARLAGGDPGDVYRVRSDGTYTLFATGLPGELVFCNGALWIVRSNACTRIHATGPD